MKINPTSFQLQVKIFEMAGCEYVRTQGDHLIYHYPGAIRSVVIPKYKEVPGFLYLLISFEAKNYVIQSYSETRSRG